MSSQATPCASFSEQFDSQFSQSLSKYSRRLKTPDSSDSFDHSESSECAESSDDSSSSSTGEEGPEYVSNGQAKEWKAEVGKQLQAALEIAILASAKDEEIQLHREIGVFRKFIQLEYFEALEQCPDTTVDLIRREITEAANDSSHLECIGDVDNFPSSRPSSPLSTNFASMLGSSPPKKLRVLPKAERLAKALTAVREKELSIRQAAIAYDVNRQTIRHRMLGKRSLHDLHENQQLLTPAEETALLGFVDQFVALGFPPRKTMLEEKALLMLRDRGIERPLGVNWAHKFLQRHPDYASKFPRHLDQERYWNTDATVFIKWFELYDRTCLKYGIANGDIYNMDEKGYLMGVAGASK